MIGYYEAFYFKYSIFGTTG